MVQCHVNRLLEWADAGIKYSLTFFVPSYSTTVNTFNRFRIFTKTRKTPETSGPANEHHQNNTMNVENTRFHKDASEYFRPLSYHPDEMHESSVASAAALILHRTVIIATSVRLIGII